MGSKVKMKVSGNVVEFWEYERELLTGQKKGGRRAKEEEKSENAAEIRKQTTRKAKAEFRRLVLANFDNGAKFITLTFRDTQAFDIRSPEATNKEFKKFIQKLRRRFGDFKFVRVIEFQDANKRGAVHYHFIADLPYIDYEDLSKLWGLGFVGINYIKNCDNVGAYMSKYMAKDMEDPRLEGKKSYTTSRNLDKPIEDNTYRAERILKDYKAQKRKVAFSNDYKTEHNGHCNYYEYNLKRM